MHEKFEIRLSQVDGEPVSLKTLSPEALESFLAVTSALKSLACNLCDNNKLRFTIFEGSAGCAVDAPPEEMKKVYSNVNDAMNGRCEDKYIAADLRKIQEQISRNSYAYSFKYIANKNSQIELHHKLSNSKRINVKRKTKQYTYKLKIIKGFLNQIGGKDPNYHFDYGHGEKLTINCSIEEATKVKQYLYKDVSSLIVCKEWASEGKKDEYYHKCIINESDVSKIRGFLINYYKGTSIIDRLNTLHDFIDDTLKTENFIYILSCLVKGFNYKKLHLSELKTILIRTKAYKDNSEIKESRLLLLETYNELRNK